jgi:Zn-dependent protease
MGGSIRLGTVLGFEVRLDYSWFLVFAVLAWNLSVLVFPRDYHFERAVSWMLGLSAALLLFGSVLVHEISHSLMARHYGIEVSGITLFLFGGVAQIKGEPACPRQEFLIAVVGPLVSLLIGAGCLVASWSIALFEPWRPVAALTNYVGFINLALATFNMIPGFPLDGGRILRSLLWHVTGNLRRSTRWAANFGHLFAWLLIAWGALLLLLARDLGGLWLVFVGWFLNNAASSAYHEVVLRRALEGVSLAEVMSTETPVVDADMRIPAFVDGYLLRHSLPDYPVVLNGRLVGIVTPEDLQTLERDLWEATSIGTLAHAPDKGRLIQADKDAWQAFSQMLENDTPRLLAVTADRLIGVVTRDAIEGAMQSRLRSPLQLPRRQRAS